MRDPIAPHSPENARTARALEERRRSERHPFSGVADVTEPLSNAGIFVRISDLGHGCYADSLTVFPTGTTVKLSLRYSGRHFETLAKVVYAKSGMGMGLSFEDLSAAKQSLLREWLLLFKGEPSPADETGSTGDRTEADTQPFEPQPRTGGLALTRLIESMMHKGQLTDMEGRELLKQLQEGG